MSSLADRIAATSRKPSATVRLDGARWADVLSLSREQSYGQGASSGEVVGRDPPVTVVEGETRISWMWGYDGYEVAGFSGVVTKILQKSYPNQWRLQVADPLWLAGIRRSDLAASPLNNVAASAAITQFLSAAGLTRLSIPALAASGSAWGGAEWKLGQLTPVSFANTTPLAACQEICAVLGYWLYATADGTIKATLLERRPSDSPFRTLRWGHDFLIAGAPDRERDASQVKNRVVVKGANTGVQGAQIRDIRTTEGTAGDRTLEYSSSLIEFVNESEAGNASCGSVAERLRLLWSRQPNMIRVGRFKADPRLSVGMTLAIECAKIGYDSPKPFFIYSLSTQLDLQKGDFAQSLVLDGGTGKGGYTELPPPEASFSWRLVSEGLNGTSVIEVFLDGTGSHSLGDGEIVAWAWATSTAVLAGTANTATGAKAMFVYPVATATASITLTVTDTSSKTGAITQIVTLAGDATTTLNKRVISVALGSAWAATKDGGATWGSEGRTACTLVPEVGGAALLATDGAALRTTSDTLATASTLAAALGGTITALAVTQVLPLRVWAAVGPTLKRSVDGGATFAAWATLPASIVGVLEDPAVLESVFCLAGANVYHGTDVLYAGPAGATARQMTRGQSGATTWIAYTGTFIGSPLQRIEGPITATFPVVSPAVTEIRAIALSADELTVWAWDAQGRGWTVSSATGIAVANAATLAAGETAMHALADPDDAIVYLATFGASAGIFYKYWPLADRLVGLYVPSAGRQSHRVGLGGPALPKPGNIIVPTWGVTGANDGIWIHDATGWRKVAAPVAGAYWSALAINPFSRLEWILVGNSWAYSQWPYSPGGAVLMHDGVHSAAWRTTDGGATWAALTITAPTYVITSPEIGYLTAAWSQAGGWVVAGAITSYAHRAVPLVWRPGGAWGVNDTTHEGFVGQIAAGLDGEILFVHEWGDWISSASAAGVWTAPTSHGDNNGDNMLTTSVVPGTRTAYAVRSNGLIHRSDNYRSAAWAQVGTATVSTASLVAMPDGSVYGSRIAGSTCEIVLVQSGGAAAVVATLPTPYLTTLASNASRSAVGGMAQSYGFAYWDGTTWSKIDFPTGLAAGNFGRLAVTDEAI